MAVGPRTRSPGEPTTLSLIKSLEVSIFIDGNSAARYVDVVKGELPVTNSARRHGVEDTDMNHAILFTVEIIDMDDLVMFIGPRRDGSMLEVGVSTLEPRIVHADNARPKFLR